MITHCICVVWEDEMKKSTRNYRFDETDEKVMAALKERLPGKTESEIVRTSLKMYALEIGAMSA